MLIFRVLLYYNFVSKVSALLTCLLTYLFILVKTYHVVYIRLFVQMCLYITMQCYFDVLENCKRNRLVFGIERNRETHFADV